jgi:pimeloyl-ACP methyl ester carboxylesterase
VTAGRARAGGESVEVAGGSLEVVDLPGGAPALVLLHEGLGSVGLWRDFPDRLHGLTGRRVLAFSRFGHGRSSAPPCARTPAFFHEEALEVLPSLLAALDVDAPILVGHSDGASIAIIHAAAHPVAGLVLLAPHVFVEPITVDAIRETRAAYVDGELRTRMARHHDDPDAAFWGWCDVWLDPAFGSWTLDDEVRRLTAPALLIQGSEDPYGSLAQIDRVEALSGGPCVRLVLPGGHSPHLEHPDTVAAAIADHLPRFV